METQQHDDRIELQRQLEKLSVTELEILFHLLSQRFDQLVHQPGGHVYSSWGMSSPIPTPHVLRIEPFGTGYTIGPVGARRIWEGTSGITPPDLSGTYYEYRRTSQKPPTLEEQASWAAIKDALFGSVDHTLRASAHVQEVAQEQEGSEQDWEQVRTEVLRILQAEMLDRPDAHLAYVRDRIKPVFEHGTVES